MDGIIDGPPPEPPTSPEQNIARGTKAIARVLATRHADMAAMHRKDLGWIAFEPGVVSLPPKGEVKGAGLRKIQQKHAGDLADIPSALAHGKLTVTEHVRGRRSYLIEHHDMLVTVRKQHFHTRETWVVTGYRRK